MAIYLPEPAPLPVALEDVKAFLRVSVDDEDGLLAGLAAAAAETCEAFTGRALVERAVEEVLAAARRWTRLEAAPVRAITAVAALAEDGSAAPLPAGDYAIDIDAAGDGWVRLAAAPGCKRIRVSYSAGMAAAADGLPEALRHGIVRLAAFFYTARDRQESAGPPAAVTALWRPWRRLRL